MSANNETVNRLAQPYHFSVKTYAQRYDGKIPFTIETSVHLSISDIDEMDKKESAMQVGFDKLVKFYETQGYSHVAKLEADVKPVKK